MKQNRDFTNALEFSFKSLVSNKVILLLLCSLSFIACEDFIEKNIDDKTVSVIAPPDNFKSSIILQTFWWNEMDGAETYNIQIVKGTFSYVQLFMVDTSVAGTRFQYSLTPGSYQWRIRGENNGGSSQYSTFNLTIDSTFDLTSQTVALLSPSNNLSTNQGNITFSWQQMYNADEYRIQIIDSVSNALIADEILTSASYNYTLTEGTYIWKVLAQNSISISQYSQRSVVIDVTAPNAPFLLNPANNATITAGQNDTLDWNSDATFVTDSIYIDTDSLFSAPVKSSSVNEYLVPNISPGTYFWKVKSVDGAGNQSPFSGTRKFIYQ